MMHVSVRLSLFSLESEVRSPMAPVAVAERCCVLLC
jgi:hypothetical protein